VDDAAFSIEQEDGSFGLATCEADDGWRDIIAKSKVLRKILDIFGGCPTLRDMLAISLPVSKVAPREDFSKVIAYVREMAEQPKHFVGFAHTLQYFCSDCRPAPFRRFDDTRLVEIHFSEESIIIADGGDTRVTRIANLAELRHFLETERDDLRIAQLSEAKWRNTGCGSEAVNFAR
jgi:hypothetical protein